MRATLPFKENCLTSMHYSLWFINLFYFNDTALRLRQAAANSAHSVAAALPAQFVHEVHDNAGAAGGVRMPDGNGAAVYIHLLAQSLVFILIFIRCHHHGYQ